MSSKVALNASFLTIIIDQQTFLHQDAFRLAASSMSNGPLPNLATFASRLRTSSASPLVRGAGSSSEPSANVRWIATASFWLKDLAPAQRRARRLTTSLLIRACSALALRLSALARLTCRPMGSGELVEKPLHIRRDASPVGRVIRAFAGDWAGHPKDPL